MTVAVAEQRPPEDDGAGPSPSDVGAEAAMLSAVLVVGQTDTAAAHQLVDDLATVVEPGDMWHTGHFLLWQTLIEATALGDPVDPASVSSRLLATGNPRARETAQQVLPNLLGRLAASGSATHHARKVAQCAVRRRLIETGTQLVQRAHQDTFDEQQDVAPVMAALEQATAGRAGQHTTPIRDVVERAADLIESPEKIDVIPSGLHDLDMIVPGLKPGQLVVVAARPGVGKSTFAQTICLEAVLRMDPARRTLLVSMEMDAVAITHRMLAARSGVELSRILSGNVDDSDWSRLAKHMEPLANAPLVIDDSATVTIGSLRSAIRREVRRGLGLVVVDYLGLMQMPRAEKRQEAVAETVRELKRLAGEHQVPILLLAQLNRGSELRSDKRPVLSDLRESGEIEQSADVVLLIHRPDMYDKDDRPGEADVIVAKHRNGQVGVAAVAFRGHYSRFDSMAMWDSR